MQRIYQKTKGFLGCSEMKAFLTSEQKERNPDFPEGTQQIQKHRSVSMYVY